MKGLLKRIFQKDPLAERGKQVPKQGRGFAWFEYSFESGLPLPAELRTGKVCMPLKAGQWYEDGGTVTTEVFLSEAEAEQYAPDRLLFKRLEVQWDGITKLNHFRAEDLITLLPTKVMVL
jgi:hypothetical protein